MYVQRARTIKFSKMAFFFFISSVYIIGLVNVEYDDNGHTIIAYHHIENKKKPESVLENTWNCPQFGSIESRDDTLLALFEQEYQNLKRTLQDISYVLKV